MNDADLSSRMGSRIRIGKSMGLIQVYKAVATMVAALYDVELTDAKWDWKVTNSWVPGQQGLEVKISNASLETASCKHLFPTLEDHEKVG